MSAAVHAGSTRGQGVTGGTGGSREPLNPLHDVREAHRQTALPAQSTSSPPSSIPPVSATLPSHLRSYPTPSLPAQTISPPNPLLRASLRRRRSSYPPATLPGSAETSYPWASRDFAPTIGTSKPAPLSIIGPDPTAMAWTPGVGWETLLALDAGRSGGGKMSSPSGAVMTGSPAPPYNASAQGSAHAAPLAGSVPERIAQMGSDLVWRTILGSRVDVEEVGDVEVVRVLQEVWMRGGGEQVTAQGLWPTILISLSFMADGTSPTVRMPSPSAHAAVALQNLYNLTLRHWEPAIFTGLLSSFIALPAAPPQSPFNPFHSLDVSTTIYGSATPKNEVDLSQWTDSAPEMDWSLLSGNFSTGFTPRPAVPIPGPSSLAFEVDVGEKDERRSSVIRADEDQVRGLDELLAEMETRREAEERQTEAAREAAQDVALPVHGKRSGSTFSMPTPETDSSASPIQEVQVRRKSGSVASGVGRVQPTPPSSNASPLPETNSLKAVTASCMKSFSGGSGGRAAPPMNLTMPTSAFVPPPPMCMFFSPAFHDLQKGKVAVWKGDLAITGRGGGKFSVLIVGEETTGHLWQSHLWPQAVSYPPEEQPDMSCTAMMIPVAHLAREGFTPVAMGMVLCNDANISQYVSMVQGLHAEGVAFHLPGVARLPIVFLPAKFSSEDPLQRLGVAFMSKPGLPLPPPPNKAAATPAMATDASQTERPPKKRRRQSAPAKAGSIGGSLGHRRKGTIGGMQDLEEEAVVEEE